MSKSVPAAASAQIEDLPKQFVTGELADKIWYARCAASGQLLSFRWSGIRLHDGTLLTDQKNATLLRDAKHYFVLYASGKVGVKPRAGTLRASFQHLSGLIKWISRRNITRFCDLTETHIVGYRNYLRTRTPLEGRDKEKGRLAQNTQSKHRAIILNLLKMQHLMPKTGTRFNAAQMRDIADLLRVRNAASKTHTKRIPDDIFEALVNEAIRWLRDDFPKVLKLEAIYKKYPKLSNGPADIKQRQSKRQIIGRIPASETVLIAGKAVPIKSFSYWQLRRLISISRAAAMVIIAALTGMRASEIFSLRGGALKTEKIRNKGLKVLRLAGTLYKTSSAAAGEPAMWVAGWDEPDNPVRLAISALESMPRTKGATGLFAAAYPSFTKLTSQDRERVGRTQGRKLLKIFAAHVGTNWQLSAHQFRKTFARFVVLSGSASILALMRHFKHISVLMTAEYLPDDPELLNDLIEASEELIAEKLHTVFGSEKLGGLAGQRIIQNNAPFRGSAGRTARERLVKMTMRDPNADVRLSPYGICIYDRNPKCGDKIENVGLDVCVGCSNFVISHANLGFWEEHASVLRANISALEELGIVNLALARQLHDAEKQIQALSG